MDTNVSTVTFRPPGYAQRFHDRLPEGCTLAWGARAIYRLDFASRKPTSRGLLRNDKLVRVRTETPSNGYVAVVDILHDRMEMVGGTKDERKAFADWLDTIGLPNIRTQLADQRVSTRDNTVVELDSCKGYQIIASPNASYGYLYILAWRKG